MSGSGHLSSGTPQGREFSVLHQKLDFEIDFLSKSLRGKTSITIQPLHKDLKTIRLHCRQCRLIQVAVEGKAASTKYEDPYLKTKPNRATTIEQHHITSAKLAPQLRAVPEEELNITLPKSTRIRENPYASFPKSQAQKAPRQSTDTLAPLDTPMSATVSEQAAEFMPLRVDITFEIKTIRDGVHFLGVDEDDMRYPHLYTLNSPFPGTACSLFPCVDDPQSRCTWDISIKCPRTLQNLYKSRPDSSTSTNSRRIVTHIDEGYVSGSTQAGEEGTAENEELSLEINVVCAGDLTDEIVDPKDATKKTVSFSCAAPVSANQIGFAVGPFEDVDLSDYREVDDDDKLGSQAIRVHGFCLPGRADEVRNTCMPMAKAIDFFTTTYTAFPLGTESYRMCFVDDLPSDITDTVGLSICSSRLLFPEDIIEPIHTVTRKLIYGLATQYSGISLVAKEPADTWIIVGIASFMADIFMKTLGGNNEYRYRQKLAADRIFELDIDRPSLDTLGTILHLDPSEREFLMLKAGVVLFILDRRLTKSSGSAGMSRIIGRILTTAKARENDSDMLSTERFQRQCEKLGHVKLDAFFQQWIHGAGCPQFQVSQRFNKKKFVVEMMIKQIQGERQQTQRELHPSTFLRDTKEELKEVYSGGVQTVFTGPMTIRIHEADGTPYEHIIDIKEPVTKCEIPYNTKYKRLKRSKRQKERSAAAQGVEASTDTQDDVLLYCLGDVLQSDAEVADWRLTDWTKDDEEKMSQESYEWIRMDADFEWICKLAINIPPWMFVSQLQQDRDVVAQMESLQYMAGQNAHPMISTILTRTLMDRRYFHGIRTMAAAGLTRCARNEVDFIGLFHLEKCFQELYCVPDSAVTIPNDFSDRTSFLIQCAIPAAISNVRDNMGRTPSRVKRFFIDKIKFNDNSNNEFSDCHYVVTLMKGLAHALSAPRDDGYGNIDGETIELEESAVEEIERYKRIDEWVASFQNLYTTTALECLARLAMNGIVMAKRSDFFRYTRDDNLDLVRLKAFESIVKMNMMRQDSILSYCFYTVATDGSRYVRNQLFQILGRGLGQIAIGDKTQEKQEDAVDGLIIEQEANTENRAADIKRKTDIRAALEALKAELGPNQALRSAIWEGMSSDSIAFKQLFDLLELCGLLIEPKDTLTVKLKLPRYWKCEHTGKGVLKFSRTNKVRTKAITPRVAPTASTKEKDSSGTAAPPASIDRPTIIRLKSNKVERKSSSAELVNGTPSVPQFPGYAELRPEHMPPTPQSIAPTVTPAPSSPKPTTTGPSTQSDASPTVTPVRKPTILKLKSLGTALSRIASSSSKSTTNSTTAPSPSPQPNGKLTTPSNTASKKRKSSSPSLSRVSSTAMSPPLPVSNPAHDGEMHPPSKKRKTSVSNSDSKASTTPNIPNLKKRKSTEVLDSEAREEEPLMKKTGLKLRLGSLNKGGSGSPPPPTPQ